MLFSRNYLSYFLFLLLALPPAAAAERITLPNGLPVKVLMSQPVTFSTARVGTNVDWTVADDVVIGGYVVIRKGATARSKVDTAIDSGSRPRITLKVQFIELATGERALIRATEHFQDRRADSLDFYGSGIVSNTQNNTVIPEGAELTVFIDQSIALDGQTLAARGALSGEGARPASKGDKDVLKVPDGAAIDLRLGRTISSEDAEVGDRVDFQVINELRVGPLTVIPKGATVWATVTEAKKKRSMGRAGKLALNIDFVRLPSGEKLPLRAQKAKTGDSHKKAMTGAMVATTVLVWPLAPAWLMLEGEDTSMKKGMDAVAFVDGDFVLDPVLWGYSSVSVAQPLAAQTQPTTTEVYVTSSPSGAEIFVDGVYVGSTPSSIGMKPGDHVILVKKSGFAGWTRSISVTSGKVSVTAELQRLTRSR
jgi:hypothetical protein